LTVRENQKELSEQFEKIFKIAEPASINTGIDAGHSRVEIRKYTVLWII